MQGFRVSGFRVIGFRLQGFGLGFVLINLVPDSQRKLADYNFSVPQFLASFCLKLTGE